MQPMTTDDNAGEGRRSLTMLVAGPSWSRRHNGQSVICPRLGDQGRRQSMPRYILIDNNSGYIFGDTADLPKVPISTSEGFRMLDAENPVDAARWLDEAVVGEHGRIYEEVASLGSNETGYFVYRADRDGSDLVTVVENGQDQEMIEAVEAVCPLVATLRVSQDAS